MGWHNPPLPWTEFNRRLSGKAVSEGPVAAGTKNSAEGPDCEPVADTSTSRKPVVPYAELHAHSNFSFLDGASSPTALVREAAQLGLHGLALTDHDGFYGAAQMAEAAEQYPQLKTVYGAELSLGLSKPQNGMPDPEGDHLLILARGTAGYHRLSSAITQGQLAHGAAKGRPRYHLEELAHQAGGDWFVLTGCRKGSVRRALAEGLRRDDDGRAAQQELGMLADLFGPDRVLVELYDHGNPRDSADNDLLDRLASKNGFATIASNNVHYATPAEHRVASALAAVRAHRSLAEMDGWLPAGPQAFLRSGAEMAQRFARFPGAVQHTVELAQELAFPLRKAKPRLPKLKLPAGHSQMSHLRQETWARAASRYPKLTEKHRTRIEKELEVIEQKDFPGYFLIVKEIVDFAKAEGILCQGRGSAASSAVCYVLGITAIDPILYDLPFERFLNVTRDEEPDIDVDFDARRREEVIQHVYDTYGRLNAALVSNVVSYRSKIAVRDMAKALGYSPGQQDAWSKQLENPYGQEPETEPETDIPAEVRDLARQIAKFPRHLGIHPGGMVLTDQPVSEICPIENARMDNRTVLQWDKDDCAYMGLVKFDLLGLGMLAALQYCFDMISESCGEEWTLATLPKEEPAVYDQLCLADSIGVFQVESRAQMGMLPRLKPREFYDLVIEVALVRPGPIQGGAVHPYMRRRADAEERTYAHPKLIPVLKRTLGVPVFQEQLMQMAVAVGNCDAQDADLLRRAMGSKRGEEKIESIREKLFAGMAENGIEPEVAKGIYLQISAFASFGFAESHALSFALLVYASAWLRLHYPAAFLAALLRAQPMGFYAARTLVEDAQRHGVEVREPDILRSGADSGLEPKDLEAGTTGQTAPGLTSCLREKHDTIKDFDPNTDFDFDAHRRDPGFVVRLGLSSIKAVGKDLAERIVAAREQAGHFTDLADLARWVQPTTAQLEALAAAGALESLSRDRRAALWEAGPAAAERQDQLPGTASSYEAPMLPAFSAWDKLVADLNSTGISPGDHPMRHLRTALKSSGVLRAIDLKNAEPGRRVMVSGVVTHRQRPATANSITFLNLEDETGLVNVVCSQGAWKRFRRTVRESEALSVRGILERSPEGVVNLLADYFEPLDLEVSIKSRDFQ